MTIKRMITYRSVWMGLAILWIMFFHSDMALILPFSYLKVIGYGGVDIFFFASGIGNYYSYLKDENPLEFFKRRIFRLIPVYIPVILIWCLFSVMGNQISILSVPGNLLGIQGFTTNGGEFSWFFTGIMICYLLTPYFAAFIKKNKMSKNILLVLLLIVISSCFIKDTKFLISMVRIPIYVIGMLFAKNDDYNVRKLAGLWIGGFVLGNIALFCSIVYATEHLWDYGLYWYPFILITPFLCWIMSEVSALFDKSVLKVIPKFFSLLGGISFELFMIHWLAFEMFRDTINSSANPNLFWVAIYLASILCAFGFSFIVKSIRKLNREKKTA
jgi:peptidoglycan/LPS O-acetylase OafA/YrhL